MGFALDSQAFAVADDGGFAGAVGAMARQTSYARHAGDADQGSAAACPQGLEEGVGRVQGVKGMIGADAREQIALLYAEAELRAAIHALMGGSK